MIDLNHPVAIEMCKHIKIMTEEMSKKLDKDIDNELVLTITNYLSLCNNIQLEYISKLITLYIKNNGEREY